MLCTKSSWKGLNHKQQKWPFQQHQAFHKSVWFLQWPSIFQCFAIFQKLHICQNSKYIKIRKIPNSKAWVQQQYHWTVPHLQRKGLFSLSKSEQNSAEVIILYELFSRIICHQEDSKIKDIHCINKRQISSATFQFIWLYFYHAK